MRMKVGLFTAGFLVALLVVLFLVASRVMVRGFGTVEERFMRNSVQTFEGHMPFEYFEVSSRIRELAPAQELEAFAVGINPDFEDVFLAPERLDALNLSFVAVLDATGRIVRWYDSHPELAPTSVHPQSFETIMPPSPNALSGPGSRAFTLSGLLLVGDLPSIVAMTAFPIDTDAGRSSAALAVGRVLDARQIALIEDLTHLAIDVRTWSDVAMPADMLEAKARIEGGEPRPVAALDDARMAGYTQLRDLNDEPLLLARVVRPRTVFAQARESQRTLLGSVALVGALFGALILWAVQRGVLNRFAGIGHDLERIAADRDHRFRVAVSGNDELARLAVDVNTMLDALEASEEALRESERRYALAAEGGNDGIWDWNLRTNEVYYSPRWLDILGIDEGSATPDPDTWLARIHPDDRIRVQEALQAHRSGAVPHFENEHRLQRADGTYRWVLVRGKAIVEDGEPVRLAGSLTDITDRGLFDPLTGLPNRHLLEERIDHVITKSRSDRHPGAALLGIRVSRLDAVRESLGQEAVDGVSLEMSKRLRTVLREADTVARTASDTYVILLEDAHAPRTLPDVASRVRDALAGPVQVHGREVTVVTSLGILADVHGYERASDALRDTGIATTRAAERPDSYVFFDSTMFTEAMNARQLELDLRGAGERGELRLELQPVVDIETRAPIWHEALVRWQHPERGRLMPDAFIPLAEDSGAIIPMGAWVVHEAAQQVAALRAAGRDVAVSVNLSAEQIFHPGLVATVRSAIFDAAIEPEHLHLEVTETALMRDAGNAAEILAELKDLGVGIVMDDFGTGYSSLSYIHALPLDAIKIDRSFVTRMTEDMTSLEIVRTIIGLARTLGLTVVAEGIEFEKQAALLLDLGCTVGQGYLYSRPRTLEELLGTVA